MEQMDILSFTFLNRKVVSAIYSNQQYLNEVIVFVLGEQLILGPTDRYTVRENMHGYLASILDPLDLPMIENIIDELQKHVDVISSDTTYGALYLSGECFLKYEYQQSIRYCKLMVYCDPIEFADPTLK